MSDAAEFWKHITPEARVSIWRDEGTAMAPATVVRVNRSSLTVRLDTGEIRRVPRPAIADLAPGERDRQHRSPAMVLRRLQRT